MVNARAIARLGTLAVGLGVGLAVASTPIVAVADSSVDWLSELFGGMALPAPAVPDLNLAISIDGYSLVSSGTASADSGSGDIAIAYGDGAYASAEGGNSDFALADGSEALAQSGGLSTDTGANDDTAIDVGNNSIDGDDAAWAGNSDLNGGTDGGTGSGDTAIDIGNNSNFFDSSVAGAGGLVGGVGNGDNDTSIDIGNNSGGVDGPWTVAGNDNFASSFGDDTSVGEGAVAGDGDSNIADSVGPNAYTFADGGNSNIAYVFDPFGTGAGSEADAGAYGNSDLAVVFGDGLTSTSATGGDYLYDILSPAGDLPGTAAATSGGFLAELLSLF
jgi:hypothetical protein